MLFVVSIQAASFHLKPLMTSVMEAVPGRNSAWTGKRSALNRIISRLCGNRKFIEFSWTDAGINAS